MIKICALLPRGLSSFFSIMIFCEAFLPILAIFVLAVCPLTSKVLSINMTDFKEKIDLTSAFYPRKAENLVSDQRIDLVKVNGREKQLEMVLEVENTHVKPGDEISYR